MVYKVCRICSIEKPLEDFSPEGRNRDGHYSYCKQCQREKRAAWRAEHPDEHRRQNRIRYWKNPVRARASARLSYYRRKEIVLSHYGVGGKAICVFCGEARIACLSIDHIAGGGLAHRRSLGLSGGGGRFYSWLIQNNFPSGYQTLCMNCQYLKKYTNREL